MYYYFLGMHWFWWVFWILLWMVFFSFMMPMSRSTYRELQSPLQLLKGDMQEERSRARSNEERRGKLLRDEGVSRDIAVVQRPQSKKIRGPLNCPTKSPRIVINRVRQQISAAASSPATAQRGLQS